jgi:very-short-patch-repair endonuclease
LIQRIDFVVRLPHLVRGGIELDSQQHYSKEERGQLHPSPAIYAQTVRGDRDLRLAGYEVYRFSGHELHTDENAAVIADEFFAQLFRRHGVPT